MTSRVTRSAALCLPCLLVGGTEVATLNLARTLSSMGFAVTVITYFDELDTSMVASFEEAGIELCRLHCVRNGGAWSKVVLARRLLSVLSASPRALVWVQYMTPTLLPLLVARLMTRCLIAQVHVAPQHFTAKSLRRLRLISKYWTTRFICVSHATERGIFGTGRKLPRSKCGWPEKSIVIGYVGRLVREKGADVLVRSLGECLSSTEDIRLVLVGDGDDRAELESFVADAFLSDRVFFAGKFPRESVSAAILGFDILVVPSREEGFGISALEGMALGLPVIVSRLEALNELIAHQRYGLSFEVGSYSDLAKQILKLATAPGLRKRIGVEARQYVLTHYGAEVYQRRIGELIAGVADSFR